MLRAEAGLYRFVFGVFALAATSIAAAQDVPADLARLVEAARITGPLAAWCRAEFRAGHPGAFAVAVSSPEGGGRYIAVDSDGRSGELGTFTRGADLSCYSRAEAIKLDATIRTSETIHGSVSPRWNTTVVCGFLDDTTATCWQYSPAERTFVRVGRWTT